jgi:uncharacterized membrane protein YgdD (TMEM256/DUF423 family)
MPAVPLSTWIAAGALLAAVAVAAGAFGAHGLAERLEPRALGLWETAARYRMYAAVGLLAVGLAGGRLGGGAGVAGWSLLAGAALFSGTVAALALGAPRWLGAITPIGGVLLILGFVALAWSALRRAG